MVIQPYPQVGRLIGYFPKEEVVDVCENLNCSKRVVVIVKYANARFKYTVDRLGVDWIKNEINNCLSWKLEEARPYYFDDNGDRYGWTEGSGQWHYTLFVQNGRQRH